MLILISLPIILSIFSKTKYLYVPFVIFELNAGNHSLLLVIPDLVRNPLALPSC